MRVLVTHERFMPDFGGGGEYVAYQRVRHLRAAGIEATVLCAGDPAITEHGGVPTRRLPISRYAFNLAVHQIARAARAADLLHTFTYHAALPTLIAGRLSGKPVVCEFAAAFGDAWLAMRGPLLGPLYRASERLLLSLPFDAALFLSEASLARAASTSRARRKLVVPPGIERANRDSGADARPPGSAGDGKEDLVLFAGKFEARKGVDLLPAVARACPEIRFLAMGWGTEGAAWLRAAAPVNLVIEEARGEAYRRALRRARIFLFPSRSETFGLVVAEAMAAGCAVVSTLPLGYRGRMVAPDDIEGTAAAVRELWRDPEHCATCGFENSSLAARYDWAASTERVLGLYSELLGHGGKAMATRPAAGA